MSSEQKAPRVTPEQVGGSIVGETYTVLPNGRTTVCQLTLYNGFTVEGQSACVSDENFNAEIGNKIARQNAVEKIWPLLGFLLAQKIWEWSHAKTDPYPRPTGKLVTIRPAL